jgi:hypothetical protein
MHLTTHSDLVAEREDRIMGNQVISDGVYTIMGPGGQLASDGERIMLMEPGFGPPDMQFWQLSFDKGKDNCTMRNLSTGRFAGTDGDPDQPDWMLRGTGKPFGWKLADGGDDDPSTFLVTSAASKQGMRLVPSIIRLWPQMAAIGPPTPYYDFEWTFRKAG